MRTPRKNALLICVFLLNSGAVILMGQKELFEGAIGQTGFEQLNKYDILVSGKKAAIYKLRKKALTTSQ